jgi:hypothetical protein
MQIFHEGLKAKMLGIMDRGYVTTKPDEQMFSQPNAHDSKDSGKRPSMGGSNFVVAWPEVFNMASTSTSWPLKLSALLFSTKWTTCQKSLWCCNKAT